MPIGKGTPPEAFIENLQQVGQLAAGDPDTQSPSESVIGQVTRTACNGWSTSPTSEFRFGASNNFMRELCNAYFQSNNYAPPDGQPQYQGGQCPILYTVRCTVLYRDVLNLSTGVVERLPQTSVNITQCLGPLGELTAQVINVSGDAQSVRFTIQCADRVATGSTGTTSSGRRIVGYRYKIEIIPPSGVSDDCGDLPPIVRPGTAPTYVWGEPAVLRQQNLTFNYTVNPPAITPDGGVELIVDFGDFEIDLFGGSDPAPRPAPPPPPGPGEPFGPEVPVGEGGGTEGDTGQRELRGLKVTVPSVPQTPRVEFGEPNELYYNLGWVAFGNEVAFGEYQRIISQEQWFPAFDGANRYRVKLNPFVTASVQPYVKEED